MPPFKYNMFLFFMSLTNYQTLAPLVQTNLIWRCAKEPVFDLTPAMATKFNRFRAFLYHGKRFWLSFTNILMYQLTWWPWHELHLIASTHHPPLHSSGTRTVFRCMWFPSAIQSAHIPDHATAQYTDCALAIGCLVASNNTKFLALCAATCAVSIASYGDGSFVNEDLQSFSIQCI